MSIERLQAHYMLTELRETFSQVNPGVSLTTLGPGRC